MTPRRIPDCPIHEKGDPTCHYPDTFRAAVLNELEEWQAPSVMQQLRDLKWEIAFVVLLLTAMIGYVALGS